MKLPEPSTEQLLEQALAQFKPQIERPQRVSTDTAIGTPGAIATVVVAGVVFNTLSPLWLLLAVPLAVIGWGCEIKWWAKR